MSRPGDAPPTDHEHEGGGQDAYEATAPDAGRDAEDYRRQAGEVEHQNEQSDNETLGTSASAPDGHPDEQLPDRYP